MMKQALKQAGITTEFHNADLDKKSRNLLENRFRNELIPRIVVATSTLAWGCYAKGTLVLADNGIKKD